MYYSMMVRVMVEIAEDTSTCTREDAVVSVMIMPFLNLHFIKTCEVMCLLSSVFHFTL